MLTRLYEEYKKWGLEISLEKTEYLVVNSDAKFEVLINESALAKQVDKFKYLGIIVDGNGIGSQNMRYSIQEGIKVIGVLNAVRLDKTTTKNNKKRIGHTMVESLLMYGCKVWSMKEDKDKRRITTVEMDYLRRSTRTSKLERHTHTFHLYITVPVFVSSYFIGTDFILPSFSNPPSRAPPYFTPSQPLSSFSFS